MAIIGSAHLVGARSGDTCHCLTAQHHTMVNPLTYKRKVYGLRKNGRINHYLAGRRVSEVEDDGASDSLISGGALKAV